MKQTIKIQPIMAPTQKMQIVSEVLADLPEWFGLPQSTQAYIESAKGLSLWVATKNEDILGFITLGHTSLDTAEIDCMGVKKAYHHQGIGTLLYQAAEKHAQKEQRFLQVKTVAEGHYPQYDQTIQFYRSLGFVELEVFPTLWDPWNPCLVMIKALW